MFYIWSYILKMETEISFETRYANNMDIKA